MVNQGGLASGQAVVSIVGLALVALAFSLLLREAGVAHLALAVSLVAGVVVTVLVIGRVGAVVAFMTSAVSRTAHGSVYLSTVLRVIGVSYLAALGAELCRDAGESALASRVELAGKVIILSMGLPILTAVVGLLMRLLP